MLTALSRFKTGILLEKFDIRGLIRSLKSKKDRRYKGLKKIDKQ